MTNDPIPPILIEAADKWEARLDSISKDIKEIEAFLTARGFSAIDYFCHEFDSMAFAWMVAGKRHRICCQVWRDGDLLDFENFKPLLDSSAKIRLEASRYLFGFLNELAKKEVGNSASAMIEIVKAAKRIDKEVDEWIASADEGETRHPSPGLVDLKKILQKFEESE